MTLQEDVLSRLRTAAPSLRSLAVKEIWVFGSVARGEAKDGSDVDILVDLSAPVSLFDLVRLRRRLEGLLGRRVIRNCANRSCARLCVPPRDPRVRLRDILEAIERIQEYTVHQTA